MDKLLSKYISLFIEIKIQPPTELNENTAPLEFALPFPEAISQKRQKKAAKKLAKCFK